MYREDPEIAKKYRSRRWASLRKEKKLINPFCERCLAKGVYTPTYIVHHKEYVTGKNYEDDNIFFNIENLESLCLACHNTEHFKEDLGYMFDENGDIYDTKNS